MAFYTIMISWLILLLFHIAIVTLLLIIIIATNTEYLISDNGYSQIFIFIYHLIYKAMIKGIFCYLYITDIGLKNSLNLKQQLRGEGSWTECLLKGPEILLSSKFEFYRSIYSSWWFSICKFFFFYKNISYI